MFFCLAMCSGLLLRCGTADGQTISKKRERQVGEAQGALVVAQAQVSSLEMQLQDLTAVQKQASVQHTLSDLGSATAYKHANHQASTLILAKAFGQCMQGSEANAVADSSELAELRSALEAAESKAAGHYHALQEACAQAQACCLLLVQMPQQNLAGWC